MACPPTVVHPSREAPLLRAATVAGLLGVNEGRSSAFDEHAQIEAVLQDGDLLVRNLAPLQALTNQLGDRGIHADAETLVLLCRAKEEHGVADFEGVATAAVERGRLDPDEALRILLADAPALAEGLL